MIVAYLITVSGILNGACPQCFTRRPGEALHPAR